MDRALKERIIGAIVLVVFAILVVPIFLDGPPTSDELVTETVVLPGQSEQKMQTQVLERDRDTPVPAPREVAQQEETPAEEPKETPAAAAEATRPEPEPDKEPVAATREAQSEASPEREPAPEAAPKAETSTTGMWAVQLGAFSDQQRAETLAAQLRKQQFAAFLSKVSTDKGDMHRVRVGPQADRAAANAMAKKLSAEGHPGKVVPHP